MQTTKLQAVLLASLLTLGIHIDAGAVAVMGASSCGNWVKDSQEGEWPKTAQRFWLVGYLSGLAVGTKIDVLKDASGESLHLWVDNYCRNNPLDNIANAGYQLFLELRKRAGL